MMNLCQKTISSSLSPSNTMDNKIVNFPFFQAHHHHHQNTVFLKDDQNPTVENSSFPLPPPASDILDSFFKTTKMDPPGIEFLEDVGGSVDGLMSCTESLGFESSDERRVDDLIENLDEMEEYCLKKSSKSLNFSKSKLGEKRMIKMFPPPLSSMSKDGTPKSYLQPMRIDGRLKLTEVRLFRAPEILQASRQDGRLRLHLIQDHDENEDEKNEEMDNGENDNGVNMQEALDDVADYDDDEWLEERVESRLLSQSDDDDGLIRRCYDGKDKTSSIPSSHHRHHHGHHQHDIHVWRQQLMC